MEMIARAEDSIFLKGVKYHVFENRSHLYLRFIHGHNTWDDAHFGITESKRDKWNLPQDSHKYLKSVLSELQGIS